MNHIILFRAQPFHLGHLSMIKKVSSLLSNKEKIHIFIGSADKSGSIRNPIPIDLRYQMVDKSIRLTDLSLFQIDIHALNDLSTEEDNNYEWGRYLYHSIMEHTNGDPYITIYYTDDPKIILKWFPPELTPYIKIKFLKRTNNISATKVRNLILEENYEELKKVVPLPVFLIKEEIRDYLLKAK